MRRAKLILAIGAVSAVFVVGTFALTGPSSAVGAAKVEAISPDSSGPLDGQTYLSELGPSGKPADIEDTLIFENGMFVSTECEKLCNFPASPYFVRNEGDKVEFISETFCPHKDAKIVWRGTVENGTIKGESTWTVNRWYWRLEKKFRFEGKLTGEAS